MNQKLNNFLDLFEEVAAAFKERGLEVWATPDVIEKVAVHLSISNERHAEKGPGAVADGQEGPFSGTLDSVNKRVVNVQGADKTAYDISVSGQKYSTFDKKLFPVGLVVGKEVTGVFKQKGKYRNLVSITLKDAPEEQEPF